MYTLHNVMMRGMSLLRLLGSPPAVMSQWSFLSQKFYTRQTEQVFLNPFGVPVTCLCSRNRQVTIRSYHINFGACLGLTLPVGGAAVNRRGSVRCGVGQYHVEVGEICKQVSSIIPCKTVRELV